MPFSSQKVKFVTWTVSVSLGLSGISQRMGKTPACKKNMLKCFRFNEMVINEEKVFSSTFWPAPQKVVRLGFFFQINSFCDLLKN